MVTHVRTAFVVTLVGAAALLACDPGPLTLVGLACSDTRACGDGLECVAGRCEPLGFDAGHDAGHDAGAHDAGPVDAGLPFGVNLLSNPDFEVPPESDGGLPGWRYSGSAFEWLDGGHTGAHSGRLEVVANQPRQPTLIASVADVPFGTLLCATGWLRTEPQDGAPPLIFAVRERLDDGGVGQNDQVAVNPTTSWQQASVLLSVGNAGVVEVRVASNPKLDAGAGFDLDTVSLTRVRTPVCP